MKNNKILVIVISICIAVLITLITVIVFWNSWIGNIKLSKIENKIENCSDVLITAPLHFESYSSGAEVLLTGEMASELANNFADLADDMSFCGTKDGALGYWDTKITFTVNGEKYFAYITEENIYITGKQAYCFKPNKNIKNEYSEFFDEINELLDATENK